MGRIVTFAAAPAREKPYLLVSIFEQVHAVTSCSDSFTVAPAIYALTANSRDSKSGSSLSFCTLLVTDMEGVIKQFQDMWKHPEKPKGKVLKVALWLVRSQVYP
jgi:hypothetical protein